MAAPPTVVPCEPWTDPDSVRECCPGLDPAYDLTDAITFATEILYRLSGRQFPGACEREIFPCFPAGTLVTTLDGPRPIEDVRAGDLVLTHEGRWREVEWSRQTGHAEIVRVKGQGGVLRATADHPVWAREVKPMDWSERKVKLGAPEWRDASELVGYAWATPKSIEALPFPDLPHEDTPAFWRMVGRWIGDGWTQATESQSAQVFICCGNHEADALEAELSATGLSWVRSQERTATRFRTSDRDLRDWLRSEFGSSATNKRLPGWALGLPEATRQAILDGYVAADGSARYEGRGERKRVRTRCSSVSRPLAVSIRMLAVSLGYPATLVEYEQRQDHEIDGRKINAQPVIYEVSWLDGPSRSTWQDDDHLWARVRSVELESELQVPVYNIEVAEDHSYVAEGIVVHNCQGDNCGCNDTNYWALMSASDWIWGFVPSPGHPPAWPIPTGDGGGFVNCKIQGSCAAKCRLDCLDLPGTINEIVEVIIDGEVIPPSNYRIKAYRELCWVGTYTDRFGNVRSSWPCSNNLAGTSGVNTDREDEAAVDATGGDWRIEVTLLDADGLPVVESVDVGATDAAAVVQAALEGMAILEPGDVAVTGGPGDAGATTPYVLTWDVEALDQVPSVTITDVSLVGGGATVTQTVLNAGFLADPGTWSIVYNYGKPVTEGGRIAAAKFACQIALAMCGGDGCILPQRLKSISRQGVDMLFADPLEFLDNFQTGIYEVDLWLSSVNPNKLQRRARVFRADSGPGNTTFTG